MKTSNKILLGLLVCIFLVPLLLAASLKSKMNKGEYTVEKNFDSPEMGKSYSGTFTAFKVVKVISPVSGWFTCLLTTSNSMSYEYRQQTPNDSVKVFTSNDTLYIKYEPEIKEVRDNYEHIVINVNLPAFNNLVVDGATVIVDAPAAENLSVTLKNSGTVKQGSKNKEDVISEAPTNVRSNDVNQAASFPTAVNNIEKESIKTPVVSLKAPDLSVKEMLIYRLL